MSALNEAEKQILNDLLNQAEVVSPSSSKPKKTERNNDMVSDNELHFLDGLINNDIVESMQFEQQAPPAAYVSQQQSNQQLQQQTTQQLPHTPGTGAAESSFQSQRSSSFNNPQSGFTGQSTVPSFQGQGHGFQQIQQNQPQGAEMNVSAPDGFQNQTSGFQEQFPMVGTIPQSGQLQKSGSLSSGFPSQATVFSQQYSMDTSSAQNNLGGHTVSTFQTPDPSYQQQTQNQFSDIHTQAHLQTQQQVNPNDGIYPNNVPSANNEQVNIPQPVFQNQNSDCTQQRFLNDYSANSGANNSLQPVGQASGFQQKYTSGGHAQPTTEQRDSSQQQAIQDFSNQVAGYQQQPQSTQQQALFQQGTNMSSSNTPEQTYTPSEICFSDPLSGYSQQTGQQQGTIATNPTADSSSVLHAGCVSGVQHAQFQNSLTASANSDQGNTEMFQGQVSHFPKQQSFQSPGGSPAQPSQPVGGSPASYPQPSPDYDAHHTYTPSSQASVPSEQGVGLGFTGQTSGFSKQVPFQGTVPSPDNGPVEGSVPSSPANNYQHQSPGFSVQSPYAASGQPRSQGDQNVSSFSAHSPGFSQSLPNQTDQNALPNFQGSAVFSNNAVQEDPKTAGSFQTQSTLQSRCTSQTDPGVHSQSTGLQQPVFQPPGQPAATESVPSQPMQESSGPSSMEADVVAFLHENFQTVSQHPPSLDGSSVAVSYHPMSASQTVTASCRDQPMETQQSPYLVGSGSNTRAFHSQSQALNQQSVFQEGVAQVSQAAPQGTGFMNQTLSFQGQGNGFETPAAARQPLPLPLDGLISGSVQNQNREFTSEKLDNSSYSDISAGTFVNETVMSSSQSTGTTFNSMCTSVLSEVQDMASRADTSHFNQHTGNLSNFSHFSNTVTPPYGPDNSQVPVQHQHVPQPSNQQTVFTTQAQGGTLPLLRNSSSHDLSLVSGDAQRTFQTTSSTFPTTLANQAPPVTVFCNQQYVAGQLQDQQVSQQGMQNLTSITVSPQMSTVVSFAQNTSNPAPNSAVSGHSHNNVSIDKSPAASFQDSNQTNNTISLLTSVLQKIHAILPQALGQQQNLNNLVQPAVPSGGNQNSLVIDQTQNTAQQVLQLLQPQQNTSTQVRSQTSQQLPSQSVSFEQQQKPLENFPLAQQPNFLMQQSGQQQMFATDQQQRQQQQPMQVQRQQLETENPAALVNSLLRSLQSQGMTVVSDSQVMAHHQSAKPLETALGPSSRNVIQTPPDGANVAPVCLSNSGLPGASETPLLSSSVDGLPVDLQNIHLNLFSVLSSQPYTNSITHTIDTTPTTVPNTGSNFSKNTSVIPTPSFTQPLPVAGVGMGVAAPTSTTDVSPTTNAFPCSSSSTQSTSPIEVIPTSSSADVLTAQSVANIFFPVSTVGHEKRTETSVGYTPSSVGNFLNVTTGSASMLLNAFSMAVADRKSDGSAFKVCGFSVPDVPSGGNVFGNFSQQNQDAEKGNASAMDVGESLEGISSGIKPMDTDKPLENVAPRQSSRKTSLDDELEMETKDNVANSMLRRILTMKDEDGNISGSKAGSPTPENSPVETPSEIFIDGNTQATLIEKSERLKLSSEAQQDDDMKDEFWPATPAFVNVSEDFVPSKVQRGADDLDASSKHVGVPSVEKLFDAGGATSNSAFVFTKFGADDPGVHPFGSSTSETAKTINSNNVTDERMSGVTSTVKIAEPLKFSSVPTASIRPSTRRQKDPSLTFQFPSRFGECELRILAQPEEQHRARYLTEGSRGAVKDRSQQNYPVIKLNGYNEPAVLQVFIGSETGRVKPHGFYQACRVCGKNSTHCSEREIDGTNVIEIDILPANDMQVNMDCVGILKLRNADVEKRIGPTKAKAKKKNSTKARLVFRSTLRKPDGTFFTLQVASTPILCTQPIGQPELSRLSISELCVNQTKDLFIIGKNFLKGTRIMFQELGADETDIKWQKEAEIEVEYFQQTHLICRIPDYHTKDIEHPVQCQIVALSGGKVSDPQDFIYLPAKVTVKEENKMDTEPAANNRSLPFGVSPVALQLNRLVERTQHYTPSSTTVFQLPPGAIPSICTAPTLPTPPQVVSSTPTQPVSSVLKPATLCLPASGQTLSLGEGKGGVPVQFVLPSHSMGPAVAVDSRQLGNPPAQLVLMPAPAPVSNASLVNNKVQQPVFSLASLPSSSPACLPGVSVAGTSGPPAISSCAAPTPTTSAPVIVFLASPPTTAAASSSACASTNQQQAVNSGQVESLLKQMLGSSQSSSG